jgi:hypothetical protein
VAFPFNSSRVKCGLILAAAALGAFVSAQAADSPRVTLTAKFAPGDSLEYRIESQIATAGKADTPIANSEGPTQSSLVINLRERLDVLRVERQAAGEAVAFRLTWDQAQARSSSDAIDPTVADPAAPYAKIQGRSVEFTLAPNGGISNFKGLEDILPGGVPPADAVSWIPMLVATSQFPSGGIAINQTWKAERPMEGAPLAGLAWQMQSTYQRNESCPIYPNDDETHLKLPAGKGECAVILSEMTISRHGSAHSDATPPDFMANGLRTSGSWTGDGSILGSISLQTGLLYTATETSSQDADYEIKSATTGSAIHYVAKVQNQTGIALISFVPAAAAQAR